jgi:two-component system phosphate regulon sensor histidine kinase PhoR
MKLKNIIAQFNILANCKKYGLSPWQCPQFLFLIMGLIIIGSSLMAFALGNRYLEDPVMVVLMVLLITAILFIIAFTITNSFERLVEVSRMKTEFINIVSHQLRAPLTSLSWAIELLISGKLGRIEEKQIEYFKIIKETSNKMKELISDLLTVSRIEMVNFPIKKEEVSLENIIEELISKFNSFARASNVEIEFKKVKDLPKVFTDPSNIKQAIEGLLDNAVRYIKDKGKVIISLDKKGKSLYFEIKDNGVGIPKEEQRYIFQKFFRSENVLKYQTQGSGLSLFIAKSIIEKIGGKIGFKSQEGVGSTFWFTLPINK